MEVKHGDFTHLADNYAKYRPGYSPTVLNALLAPLNRNLTVADVGAGTGIWTRMLAHHANVASVVAIEPNQNMRDKGVTHPQNGGIRWCDGSGEATGLAETSYDVVSMASSFHWVDFEKGMTEFARILRPGGRFVALWNPRYLDDNPVLMDIEEQVKRLTPTVERVSSGKSAFVESLTQRFLSLDAFDDLLFLEGRHTVELTKAAYLGAWASVNDLQVQMGAQWPVFLTYVEERIAHLDTIKATYLTRAWSIRRV